MGVAVNKLLFFLACQVLLFGSIVGFPFSSISAIPSLTSTETSSSESSTPSQVSILVNENVLPSSPILTSPSKNFQLVIGLPFENSNYLSSTEGNSDQTSPAETWSITLPTSISIQPNVVSQNSVSETTNAANHVTLDTTSPPSSSVLSIVPRVNIDSISNGFKRELRDTISVSSQESCLLNNFPSQTFSSAPSVPQLEPIFPCVKTPVDLTQLSNQNKCARCVSGDSDNLSNSGECDCTLFSPSSLLKNVSPSPNMLAFNSPNNREPSFADLKSYVNSRQGVQCCSNVGIQNQPNIETNISPSDMIRLNNNLMKAKALQNNMFKSQPIIGNNANCENSINQNGDFMTDYQNLLRIRNDVMPKMLSENIAVKSIVQKNNDDFQRYPQTETASIQNNVPFIQNDNCEPANSGVPSSFNNIARIIKDNMNNNNNDLGCPQLRTVPIYDKDSLLNKQALSNNQNNNICLGQVMNQNTQGCPQLLAIAQNSLYQRNNNEANGVKEENCNCANEWAQSQDNNCNCIQTFTPNDNLAQALQRINLAKTNQVQNPAASINILPYGETLLDGKPINNNYISLDPISCPPQLPSCSCTDLSNLQKKLMIQDMSVPIPITPVNPMCYCIESSVPSPRNIMLAPSVNTVNTASPIMTNIAPTVPNFAITNSQFPQSCVQSFSFNQDSCFNNNIQSLNPIVAPTFIPIQSLAQVPFVNNVPSSTIGVTPSLSLSDTFVSPISRLPSVCTSIQPIVSPPYPLLSSNLRQTEGLSGASAVFSPINNIVNSLTKNILSTLISKKIPASTSLAKLPPVNPYSSNPESTASILPLSDIPVACNEYVPPMYNSIIPISSFNPNLFCIESDPCDSCVPFALSITDTYYPETSLMSPLPSDYSCLCGSIFTPSNFPQASSVIKMNNVVNMCS